MHNLWWEPLPSHLNKTVLHVTWLIVGWCSSQNPDFLTARTTIISGQIPNTSRINSVANELKATLWGMIKYIKVLADKRIYLCCLSRKKIITENWVVYRISTRARNWTWSYITKNMWPGRMSDPSTESFEWNCTLDLCVTWYQWCWRLTPKQPPEERYTFPIIPDRSSILSSCSISSYCSELSSKSRGGLYQPAWAKVTCVTPCKGFFKM